MDTPSREPAAEPKQAAPPEFASEDVAKAAEAVEPEEEPKKKAYYSPGEVMKKKGCIGCGGMALAACLAMAGAGALVAIL